MICLLLFVGMAQIGTAQQQQSVKRDTVAIRHHLSTYFLGVRYNDMNVAKNSLYNLLIADPTGLQYLDSLALIYFDQQQFASSLLVSRDILSFNEDNVLALEINAISNERLGIRQRAADAYESLYLKTEDLNALYKLAFLRYELKRYAEAMVATDQLIEHKMADEATVVINNGNNTQLEISLKASALHLKGLLFKEQDKKAEARKYFQEALNLAPEFQVAKRDLESVK